MAKQTNNLINIFGKGGSNNASLNTSVGVFALLNKKVFGPLADGAYQVNVKEISMVENKLNPDNSYIKLTLAHTDSERETIHNLFENNLAIIASQIRQQLELPEGIEITEILSAAAQNTLTLYVSHYTNEEGKAYTNYNYLPPLEKVVAQETVETDF